MVYHPSVHRRLESSIEHRVIPHPSGARSTSSTPAASSDGAAFCAVRALCRPIRKRGGGVFAGSQRPRCTSIRGQRRCPHQSRQPTLSLASGGRGGRAATRTFVWHLHRTGHALDGVWFFLAHLHVNRRGRQKRSSAEGDSQRPRNDGARRKAYSVRHNARFRTSDANKPSVDPRSCVIVEHTTYERKTSSANRATAKRAAEWRSASSQSIGQSRAMPRDWCVS